MEGFLEGMERYETDRKAEEAIHEAGHLVRETGSEVRAQAETPEFQRMGHAIERGASAAGGAISDAASTTREKTAHAADVTREKAHHAADVTRETAHHATEATKERVQAGVAYTKEKVDTAREEVRWRSGEVKESARRAGKAPGHIRSHMREGFQAWKAGLVKMIAMVGVAALVGIAAFVVLTVGFVQLAAIWLGLAWGALLVGVVYVIIAAIAMNIGTSAKKHGTERLQKAKTDSKNEVKHVVQPLKNATSRRGRPGY